ncbi:hypothetical protein [Mycobacterium sp. MS1601]|uniref:hypothetical protein n=1 Tax=Mycobacterium sp. MS1601 TaxID=1936029 RepID=UPI0012F81488|nr:hypothetical protein [Mycobacterium sp. MS1601]
MVTQLIRKFGEPLQPIPESDLIQVGFPGRPSGELTYIGSWQWDIHSEAHSPDFVVRAARAIVDAIEAREKDL